MISENILLLHVQVTESIKCLQGLKHCFSEVLQFSWSCKFVLGAMYKYILFAQQTILSVFFANIVFEHDFKRL